MRLSLDNSLSGARAATFTPLNLFAGGVAGGWWDPSDRLSLFQDVSGLVPVTASGQAVARMNDKSGNGKHATQSDVTKQPIYTVIGSHAFLQFDGINDCLVAPK